MKNFADKLIYLRKKKGWSQEELADEMGVTRQSVSKWEGQQSMPDCEKLVKLSQIFEVTTDYLIKDDLASAMSPEPTQDSPAPRQVTMEEAKEYLRLSKQHARLTALTAMTGILAFAGCFAPLAFAQEPGFFTSILLPENTGLSMGMALGIGMGLALILFGVASVIHTKADTVLERYSFMDTDIYIFEISPETEKMVRKHRAELPYFRLAALGKALCILSVIPVVVWFASLNSMEVENGIGLLLIAVTLCAVILSVGLPMVAYANETREAMRKLLQEGTYAPEHKRLRTFRMLFPRNNSAE